MIQTRDDNLGTAEKENHHLAQNLRILEKKRQELESTLAKVAAENESLRKKVQEKDDDLNTKKKQIEDLTEEVKENQGHIHEKEEKITNLRTRSSSIQFVLFVR